MIIDEEEFGLTCGWCGEELNRATMEEAEKVADQQGWRLTLDAIGQAHVTCPNCIECGFNPVRFIIGVYSKRESQDV